MKTTEEIFAKYRSQRHLMIDVETLDTAPQTIVLSLGAYIFNGDGSAVASFDSALYVPISVDEQHQRTMSSDTLRWWNTKAPAQARTAAFAGEAAESLVRALMRLQAFADNKDIDAVWSNGANFDLPIIRHACRHHGLTMPWKFWQEQCFRTFTKAFDPERLLRPKSNDHNALSDAVNQAHWFYNIINEQE